MKAMKKISMEASDHLKKNTNELTKVIFAAPLRFKKDWEPPKQTRASQILDQEDQEFLTSVVTKHADFVLSHLNSREVQALVNAMESVKYAAGDVIIQQDDIGDYLYVVKEGVVRFVIDGIEKEGTATTGTVVGELALLYDCPRSATCIAVTDCVFYRVSQETFRRIQASFVLQNDDATRKLLKASKLFGTLPDPLIKELADCMFQKKFKKGEILVKKGDPVDEIYFLKEGNILCTEVEIGGTKYANINLKPGDNIGEITIQMNIPAPGHVECMTNGIVWILTKERYTKCLKGMDIGELIQKSADFKFLAAMPIIAYSDIDRVEITQLMEKMTSLTLEPGETLATIGHDIEPAGYFVKSGQEKGGYIERTNKDGLTKKVGAGEGFGFGGDTFIVSNIKNKAEAAAYGKDHGLVKLDQECCIKTAKQHLKRDSMVTSQYTTTACGTKPVHLRKISIHDVRSVLHDEFRLGKDYRKNRSYNGDVTKETLEKKQLLGQGTFGQVWLCREPKSNSPYALKIQYKRELIEQHQADGVMLEKQIMEKMNNPFVMGLVNSQQDKACLYMMMELIQGGELRDQMRDDHDLSKPHLSESASKFYAACMVEGLSYMHRRDYVYRDLKGENVMIDKEGYCVIIDLGFAKYVPDKTFTFCGTPIFIAPEVVLNKGHNKSADIWSMGVMIYEMLFGTNPFFDYNDSTVDQRTLFKRIVKGQFQRPQKQTAIDAYQAVSADAKDIIKKMLVVNVNKRLGCGARADLEIRDHPWFASTEKGTTGAIDFGNLYRKELKAPWIPTVTSPFDGANFSKKREQNKSNLKPLSAREQKQFEHFCK